MTPSLPFGIVNIIIIMFAAGSYVYLAIKMCAKDTCECLPAPLRVCGILVSLFGLLVALMFGAMVVYALVFSTHIVCLLFMPWGVDYLLLVMSIFMVLNSQMIRLVFSWRVWIAGCNQEHI